MPESGGGAGTPASPPPPTTPATPPPAKPFSSGFATLRDVLTFIAGMAIIVNEVFLSAAVEPYALGAGIALAGLPLALQADERRGKDKT